jgi:thiamine pyrophosphokinase
MEPTTVDKRALVITGGSEMRAVPNLGHFDVVIAADSGVDSAFALGMTPDVAIGDLDSISAAGLARLGDFDVTILRSPTDKDATDTELALAHLRDIGATHALLLSPGGGRLDHAHGVLSALATPELAGIAIEAVIGSAHVTVIHGRDSRTIPRRGSHLTALHAMNGIAQRVRTSGLRWNLLDEDLAPWVSRGVSNEMVDHEANVSVECGALLVIQPEAHDSSTQDIH